MLKRTRAHAHRYNKQRYINHRHEAREDVYSWTFSCVSRAARQEDEEQTRGRGVYESSGRICKSNGQFHKTGLLFPRDKFKCLVVFFFLPTLKTDISKAGERAVVDGVRGLRLALPCRWQPAIITAHTRVCEPTDGLLPTINTPLCLFSVLPVSLRVRAAKRLL